MAIADTLGDAGIECSVYDRPDRLDTLDMRLNPDQIAIIRQAVQELVGTNARAYLFGSRLRDDVRGGDIDLLLEADQAIGLLQRARVKSALEERLAIPVDVIAIRRGAALTAFQRIALAKGIRL